MLKGFRDFLLKGNAVELAIAVVIGGAFNTIITSLTKDFIMPLIGTIGGNRDFSSIYFTLNHNKLMVGDFLNSLISFIITSAVVYFLIVLPMDRIMVNIRKEEKIIKTEKTCPECLSLIPIKAKRCKYCTSRQK